MDARVNTVDDPSTSDKNSVNFGPVTPEFCGRVCAGRATCWALPRVFGMVVFSVHEGFCERLPRPAVLVLLRSVPLAAPR